MRFLRFFGRKAGSRVEAAGAADVFTAPVRERVEALWRLTALPRTELDATYGAMLGLLPSLMRSRPVELTPVKRMKRVRHTDGPPLDESKGGG